MERIAVRATPDTARDTHTQVHTPPHGIPVSLYHHPAWIAWKERQGWTRIAAAPDVPVLYKRLVAGGSMAYAVVPSAGIARQGVLGDDAGAILERFSRRILPLLPADCAFVRWDLMCPGWTDDEGLLLPRHAQELRMNASTARRCLRKSQVEHSCTDTMVVDLSGGYSGIWSRMDERARYAVRLATRRRTRVDRTGTAGLRHFHRLHEETSERHRLPAHHEHLFRDLFTHAREHRLDLDLYLATADGEPVEGGQAAASAIVARNGQDAWYLFAASSARHRASSGPSAILYRAMIDSAEKGAVRMDLLGVGPADAGEHPLAGLTRFKSGFGGVRRSRAGAWDWVIRPDLYHRYAEAETLSGI